MTSPFKDEIDRLISKSEASDHYPQQFIDTIEYFHSVFAYILSLIEMKQNNKN